MAPKCEGYMPQNGEYMLKKSGYMPDFLGMAFFELSEAPQARSIGLKCLKIFESPQKTCGYMTFVDGGVVFF